jgi:glyoxylase I family protein
MSNPTFAHVALNCRDMAAIETFYTKYFGFRRARVVDLGSTQIVFIKSGSMYLELFQATETSPVAPATKDGPAWPGVRHLAFQVESVDAKLQEFGGAAKLSFGPFGFDDFIPGWRTAWVADPEGNIVEISQGFVDQVNPPALETPPQVEAVVCA